MNQRIISLFILLVPQVILARVYSPDANDSVARNQSYPGLNLKSYTLLLAGDFKQQATAPFRMNKKQAIHLGEFAIITTGFVLNDDRIDKFACSLSSNNSFVRKSSPVITQFGGKYSFCFLGAFGLFSIIGKDKRAQVTTLLATQALITSGVWTRIGKLVTGRERPGVSAGSNTDPVADWYGFKHTIDYYKDYKKMSGSSYYSFPSGHTSTAFSIATVFAKMYSDKPAIPIIAYSTATFVGLSRLTEHAHWMSDVFVGAALGYLCGSQVVNNYRKTYNVKVPERRLINVTVSAEYNYNNFLVGITYKL
ncbi:MAG: phosphatase PAP2 family protein [Bacteroidales bacterium]